jgi:hypothetical protein
MRVLKSIMLWFFAMQAIPRHLTGKPNLYLRRFSSIFSAICDGVVDHPQTERESKRMGHSCKPHIHRRGHPNTLVHA